MYIVIKSRTLLKCNHLCAVTDHLENEDTEGVDETEHQEDEMMAGKIVITLLPKQQNTNLSKTTKY